MRAVIQRVLGASLSVDGATVSETGKGLVVYLGVGKGDDDTDIAYIVKKTAGLRIFEDDAGKMNRSARDVGAEILFVSQFTLYGDCRKGNRPSFTDAEPPESAKALYERATEALRAEGLIVRTGVFGADMRIEQVCDGPVTICLDSRAR